MLKKLIVFMAFAAALAAHAQEDCSYQRVNEGALGGLRNQGNIGTCYAYASADLLTYCLNEGKTIPVNPRTQDIPLGLRVSANDVAFNYVSGFSNYRLDQVEYYLGAFEEAGGDPRQAMMGIIKKGGACMENIMTSDRDSYLLARRQAGRPELDYESTVTTKQLFAKLAGFKLAWEAKHELVCKLEAENFLHDKQHNQTKAYSCDKEKEIRFSHLSDNEFGAQFFSNENFMKILETTTEKNFFDTVDGLICGRVKTSPEDRKNHRRSLPATCSGAPAERVARGDDTAPLLKEIDNRLESSLPIGIGVYSTFLGSNDDAALASRKDGHAMVITGREMRDGACKYRIRNSWGSGCRKKYSNTGTDYSDEDNAQDPKYGTKFVECNEKDGGYIYISRDVLAKVLQFIYYPQAK